MVEKYLPQIASTLPFSAPFPSPKYEPNIIKVTDTNPSSNIPFDSWQGKERTCSSALQTGFKGRSRGSEQALLPPGFPGYQLPLPRAGTSPEPASNGEHANLFDPKSCWEIVWEHYQEFLSFTSKEIQKLQSEQHFFLFYWITKTLIKSQPYTSV